MNQPAIELGRMARSHQISDSVREIVVLAPAIASRWKAGQFVHVRVNSDSVPFLRRPLSIAPIQPGQGFDPGLYIRLLLVIRGEGTKLLAAKMVGDVVDLLGPLGTPFIQPDSKASVLLIAGGIGVVPLLALHQILPVSTTPTFLLGIRSKSYLPVTEREIRSKRIELATDDGSVGFSGNVVQLAEHHILQQTGKQVIVYACGPEPMLRAVKHLCHRFNIPGWVSLEVPMGCGLGACQSCAVERSGGQGYLLACKDGPIFDMESVVLGGETD
jgi:dihydroorotate dehydrogenase electron transfer subunit